ncbi:MAG TPA: hypothetical protein DCQ31_08910 [Bacteroidales bacterium]|nr:hypothetical protein [Bacteroidales bacterium]
MKFTGTFFLLFLTVFNLKLTAQVIDSSYFEGIEKWRVNRNINMQKPDGWLSISGLFWLEQGANQLGSGKNCNLKLNEKYNLPNLGTVVLTGEKAEFIPNKKLGITLETKTIIAKKITKKVVVNDDRSDDMSVFRLGDLSWFVIERSGRYAIRFRDNKSPKFANYKPIPNYEISTYWYREARFFKHEKPLYIPTTTTGGGRDSVLSPGYLRFVIEDEVYSLDVMSEDEGNFFVVFGDYTNGDDTYGSGRFVYVEKPKEGNQTIIDFNKAYNPPCAFTEFATCPKPSENNFLKLAVRAGEKSLLDH